MVSYEATKEGVQLIEILVNGNSKVLCSVIELSNRKQKLTECKARDANALNIYARGFIPIIR